MGISTWKSCLFFAAVAVFGVMLFPTERERGKLYAHSGMLDKARFYLEKQYHRDPYDLANAVRYLDSLDYHRQDELFITAGKKLERMHPDSVKLQEVLAGFYEDNMNYAAASPHWRKMLELDPRLKETKEKLLSYYILHKCDWLLGDFYESEIKKGYADLETYYSLGRLYSLEKRAKDAESVYSGILRKFPEEEKAKIALAGIYEFMKESDKAIALYREISEDNPGNIAYALGFADVLIKYKKNEEALRALEVFSGRFSKDERFVKLLADMYVKLGKTEEAIAILEALYARNQENYKLLKSLGELYFNTKNYPKAEEALKKYHEKTGGDYHSHHVLGDLLDAMGDEAGGDREYKKALGLIRGENR